MNMAGIESVLLFNFKEGPQLSAVQTALFLLQVKGRLVKKEEYAVPLSVLVSGEAAPTALSSAGKELDGQMMVFAGLKEEKLERLLFLLRANPECGQIPYKAILTETNRNWNAYALFTELQKEHAAMHGK